MPTKPEKDSKTSPVYTNKHMQGPRRVLRREIPERRKDYIPAPDGHKAGPARIHENLWRLKEGPRHAISRYGPIATT